MKTKESIIRDIHTAFAGVRLEDGISWRETDIIDDHGSLEERGRARALDEKEDWSKVPLHLIGGLRYQAALSFLDSKGFLFYLPICLIYFLEEGENSDSTITISIISNLTVTRVYELRDQLTAAQISVVRDFLKWYVTSEASWDDREAVTGAIQDHWS